jgi:hypothetical protein
VETVASLSDKETSSPIPVVLARSAVSGACLRDGPRFQRSIPRRTLPSLTVLGP